MEMKIGAVNRSFFIRVDSGQVALPDPIDRRLPPVGYVNEFDGLNYQQG
jgi:hypothetical protein